MREKKHFYIFGSGISFSISPTIHNTAFHYHNLPYAYSIRESPSIDDVRHLIASTKFGAASVTLPHKLQAHKICTSQTETARAIGAINTLTVQSTGIERRIIGDNTDWTGLHAIITTYSVQTAHQPSAGLVIGAGGASRAAVFAMHKSGVRDIYLVNRTSRTAEKVRDDFQALFEVTVVPELADLPRAPEGRGLCIDMSYKPRQTPLLTVAQGREGWTTVSGVEVLLAQAFDQFRLWTGLEPPKEKMMKAVLEKDMPVGML